MTKKSEQQTPPTSKTKISFVAPNPPPLDDGMYTVEISHLLSLTNPAPGDPNSVTFKKNYSLFVKGERFSLNPKEVRKVFPPDKTQGDYDAVLPHVVLKRRTLPWERISYTQGSQPYPYSWLAILTFSASNAPQVVQRTLADLYPSTTAEKNGKLHSKVYSYGSNSQYNSTTCFLEPGQKSTDLCMCIDLTPQMFANAPSLNDLAWNAHGRHKVNSVTASDEDYSIVVGTGVPAPGQPSVAHLVSLEGLGDQLPQDNGTYAEQPSWNTIRLVSLKQWSFQTLPLQASFESLLKSLNSGLQSDGITEKSDSQLRLPDAYQPAIYTAPVPPLASPTPFDSGYTVLSDSAYTSSWYRGPFIPSVLNSKSASKWWQSLSFPKKAYTANNATDLDVTVTTTPILDRSYSLAWQLGRMIALADKDFAVAQAGWKRDCRLKLNTLIRQSLAAEQNSKPNYVVALNTALSSASSLKNYLGCSLYTDSSTTQSGLHIPQELVDWMSQLSLLKNVPFEYLVADASMLPNESVKFFTVDQCWLAALLDGAWSLERQPGSCFDAVYQPWQQLFAGTLMPSLMPAGSTVFCPTSGVLLNSKIVPGYVPDICFNPNSGVNTLLDVQIGPNTLMVLFDKAMTTLTIQEPPEGIHFGFTMSPQYSLTKTLKYLEIDSTFYPSGGSEQIMGQDVPATGAGSVAPVQVPFRMTAGRVIQLAPLAQALSTALGIPIPTTAPVSPPALTPAEFAFELVQSVQSVCFTLPTQPNS